MNRTGELSLVSKCEKKKKTIMQLDAGMDALQCSWEKSQLFIWELFTDYVNHLQNIFIQIHDTRVAEEQVEILQSLR